MIRIRHAVAVPGPAQVPPGAFLDHRTLTGSRLLRRPATVVALIIALTFVLRVLLSTMLGLGIDESYMVAAGRHPQLSYFDHPPLAWWLGWSASWLFHTEAAMVVRLPFIALFALSTWMLFRLTTQLSSPRAGLWAVAAFNLAPVFGVTSASWVLPDGPLDAALLGFLCCLVQATGPDRRLAWLWWLLAGLCGGLALLSKYSAVLVLGGAAIALLSHPIQRRWLSRPQPWAALLLMLTLVMPVIVWNADHHWCSVAFQGGRALGRKWHPFAPLAVLGGEALFLLPWLWLPLMVVLARALRLGRHHWPSWLLACCATPAIVLFVVVSIWSNKPVLFHWAAPGYLVLFPLLGAALARWSVFHGLALRRAAAVSVGLILLGLGIVGSEVRWNWLSVVGEGFALGTSPDLAAVDWTPLLPEMRARGWIAGGNAAPEPLALATLTWHDTGKLSYAVGTQATVFCLGDDPREFGLTDPARNHQGEDVLVLVPKRRGARIENRLQTMFRAVTPQPGLLLLHDGHPAMEIAVYRGQGLMLSVPP